VWVQGLDRRHSRTAVVKLSLAEFMTETEYARRRHDPAFTALLAVPPLLEESSDVWINVRPPCATRVCVSLWLIRCAHARVQVSDIMHFLSTGDEDWTLQPVGARADVLPPSPPEGPSSPAAAGGGGDGEQGGALARAAREDSLMSLDASEGMVAASGPPSPVRVPGWRTRPVQFVFASERTGFRHLYVATWTPARGAPASTAVRAITAGPWVVLEHEIMVDRARQLVYFLGKRDTPLGPPPYGASALRLLALTSL
jgi:hypothetical protein